MLFQTTFTIQIKLINKISMYILWRFLRVSSWCASPACLIYRLLWFADINSDKTRIQFGFLISHIEPCARIAHSALQFSAQLHSRTISIYFVHVIKWEYNPRNVICRIGMAMPFKVRRQIFLFCNPTSF